MDAVGFRAGQPAGTDVYLDRRQQQRGRRQGSVALLAHPAFSAGEVDTGFIEAHGAALLADVPPVDAQTRDLALIAAALADLHSAPQAAAERIDYDPWTRADGFRGGAPR